MYRLLVLVLFAAILLGLYDYARYWSYPPCCIHIWRQADVLSVIDRYQAGAPFWAPETWNLFEGDPRILSEFPFWYWLVAQGPAGTAEFSLRFVLGLHLLALLLGLYACGRAVRLGRLQALVPPLVYLGFPVVAYYGSSYLPDIIALAYAAWGLWAYFRLRYSPPAAPRWQVRAYALVFCAGFGLAGLFKVTALIPYAAILLAEALWWLRSRRAVWPLPAGLLVGLFPLLLNVLWWGYARWYASRHADYFLLSPLPIWDSADPVADIHTMILNWGSLYTSRWMLLVLAGLLVWGLLRRHPLRPWLWAMLGVSLLGFVLLFTGFMPHDYFSLPFLWILVVPLWSILGGWSQPGPGRRARLAQVLLGLWALLHLGYARMQLHSNYYGAGREYLHPVLRSDPHFRQLLDAQVPPTAHVLCLPDDTPNLTLYALKRPGYTDFSWHGQPVDYVVLLDSAFRWRFPPPHLALVGRVGAVSLWRVARPEAKR